MRNNFLYAKNQNRGITVSACRLFTLKLHHLTFCERNSLADAYYNRNFQIHVDCKRVLNLSSFKLSSWFASAIPFLSFTGLPAIRGFPISFVKMSYSSFMFPFSVASSACWAGEAGNVSLFHLLMTFCLSFICFFASAFLFCFFFFFSSIFFTVSRLTYCLCCHIFLPNTFSSFFSRCPRIFWHLFSTVSILVRRFCHFCRRDRELIFGSDGLVTE